MADLLRRHYSDEHLLALLESGLNPLSRLIATRHLRSCWICRSRLSDLEEQLEELSGAWRQARLSSLLESERARHRFLAWTHSGAFEFPGRIWRPLKLFSMFRAPVMAGMGALLLIGGVTVWELQRMKPEPAAPKKNIEVRNNPRPVPAPPPQSQPVRQFARIEHAKIDTDAPAFVQPGPSDAQVLETEVDVWWVLHRAGACKGEPFDVAIANTSQGRRIRIHGLVPSRKRREELSAALENVSNRQFVLMELEGIENHRAPHVSRTSAPPLPRQLAPQEHDLAFKRAVSGGLAELYPLDSKDEVRNRMLGLINGAIRRAENASAEAWAIRRLGLSFGANHTQMLSPSSRSRLETIAREHLGALQSSILELDGMLSPALARFAPDRPLSDPTLDLFAAVERLRLLVETSLAGDLPPAQLPAELGGEIRSLCKFLARDLSDIDAAAERMFPN